MASVNDTNSEYEELYLESYKSKAVKGLLKEVYLEYQNMALSSKKEIVTFVSSGEEGVKSVIWLIKYDKYVSGGGFFPFGEDEEWEAISFDFSESSQFFMIDLDRDFKNIDWVVDGKHPLTSVVLLNDSQKVLNGNILFELKNMNDLKKVLKDKGRLRSCIFGD